MVLNREANPETFFFRRSWTASFSSARSKLSPDVVHTSGADPRNAGTGDRDMSCEGGAL